MVVIIYWAKNNEVEEERERIPKGFWNGGACGGESQQRVARMGFHVEES